MLDRLGFCEKLIRWIRACVFAGNLSILVNGSPTKEFNIQRGLKQGDPLAPFLFLIVAEGFGGLMKKAVEDNVFKGFPCGGDGTVVSHLQYADDTLCIGEASVQNLWVLKSILRGFHLASGLRINFGKSCLMGVNVHADFLELACSFLNCRLGEIPFNYLGLPVGANPRRFSTWDPLISYLKRRLSSWGKKHISLGGRIVLINSVLNAIPIFYMSYLKMPVQVIKAVTRIQRVFLWGGVKGVRKLSWISWKMVCREKKDGGLGVRDIKVVNMSLLSKWRWKFLQNDSALWKDVLVSRYGRGLVRNVILIGSPGTRLASSWWKDICAVDKFVESKNWLDESIIRSVNDGTTTSFWSQRWIGDKTLGEAFPRLYSISIQKEGAVRDMAEGMGVGLEWNFLWRRSLFSWEVDLVSRLRDILRSVKLSAGPDRWYWRVDPDGVFSVKSAYSYLIKEGLGSMEESLGDNKVFDQIWRSPAPSKIIAFSWQALHNRIPTRDNLALRGIIRDNASRNCVLCVDHLESMVHLLLHCDFAFKIWMDIFRWLGVVVVIPASLSILFECFSGCARNKKSRKGFRLVWHTTIWQIWKSRNDAVFNNKVVSAAECVDEIKVLTWKWSALKLKILPCLYYEWVWDPGDCFNR
jgi:hypothetical protein